MKNIIQELLNEICLDSRIENGIFLLEKNSHMDVLQEYIQKKYNIEKQKAIHIRNLILEAGKFPERQAYNKDGILVTFPTPEHKKRAIDKGTHFAENPKKQQVNIFGDEKPTVDTAVASEQPPQPTAPTVDTSTQATPAEPEKAEYRPPGEVKVDAQAIEKILTLEYTIDEAKKYGFYKKNNTWYNAEGQIVGNEYHVDGKQLIISKT